MRLHHSHRPTLAIPLVIGVLLVTASGAASQVGSQPRAEENRRLGNERANPRGRDAPGLAANPANPAHLVEVEFDVSRGRCAFNRSLDGGRSWASGSLPSPAGFPPAAAGYPTPQCDGRFSQAMDGSVVFGSGQNVYTAFATRRNTDEGFSAVVSRSADGGASFITGVVAMPSSPGQATPSYPRPEVAVQPGAGTGGADRVYVAAAATLPPAEGTTVNRARTMVAVSDDGGITWPRLSEASVGPFPLTVSDDPEVPKSPGSIEASQPIVAPDGTVFVAWRSQSRPASATNPLRGKDVVGAIFISKSTDAGATWTNSRVVGVRGYGPDAPGATGPTYRGGNFFGASTFPRIAVDPGARTPRVYVTYMQGPAAPESPTPAVRAGQVRAQDHFINADADVSFVRSTDGGNTWSTPTRINDDPPGSGAPGVGPNQRHPRVSVAVNGRVDVVWQDRRHGYNSPTNSHFGNGEARFGDTYYSFSTDGGTRFSANRRISDKSQNLDIGLDYRQGVYWNFSPALVSLRDEVVFAWQDSREGDLQTETEDIYLSRLDLRTSGLLPVRRVSGPTLPGLSVALSNLAYAGPEAVLRTNPDAGTFTNQPATSVVVVNEGDVAGAVAGGVLARANLGPVLASPASTLPPEVKAEVSRMDPVGAFVVGNEASLSGGVVRALVEAGVPADKITRVAGPTAADTARAIADRLRNRSTEAVIVNPSTPEAATASALAATLRLPVLLVDRDSIPPATSAALSSFGITKTLVIGGPLAISTAVEGQLPAPKRLGLVDVNDTSEAVVQESIARRLPRNIVYVTDSSRSMDAAVLGAAVARVGGLSLMALNGDPIAAEVSLGKVGARSLTDQLVVVNGATAAPVSLPVAPQEPSAPAPADAVLGDSNSPAATASAPVTAGSGRAVGVRRSARTGINALGLVAAGLALVAMGLAMTRAKRKRNDQAQAV
ncbi:MAG TPA: sialidase family protein [Acidimicrobiales bacterium]|nr:sialidase family protein [Acidimicrobiales bacterium]